MLCVSYNQTRIVWFLFIPQRVTDTKYMFFVCWLVFVLLRQGGYADNLVALVNSISSVALNRWYWVDFAFGGHRVNWALIMFDFDLQSCFTFQKGFNQAISIILHFVDFMQIRSSLRRFTVKKEKPAQVWKLTKDGLHI